MNSFSTQYNESPIIGDDVIFNNNAEYEENLLSEFLGGYLPRSESTDSGVDDLLDYSTLFDDVDPFANIKEEAPPSPIVVDVLAQEPVPVDPLHRLSLRSDISPAVPYARPNKYSPLKLDSRVPSRRGRPMKSTSDSKMAHYSRQYREQKKHEAQEYADRVRKLEEENEKIKQHNLDLVAKFNQLRQDYEDLKNQVLEELHQ